MRKPWKLFRFREMNKWLLREFSESEIFHSAPESFNDPFDCRVDTAKALSRALSNDLSPKRRAILEDIQRRFAEKPPRDFDLGVCCFSNNASNPLMWAHYADMHRGVCLMYTFPPKYFADRYPPNEADPYFVGCERVHYGDNAYTDWLVEGDLDGGDLEPIELAASRTLVTKAKCWGHEKEFRTVVSQSKWAMKFEPQFLTQVIFGIRTPTAHKEEVKALARRSNPSVVFGQAQVSPSKDFAIEFPRA